MNATSQASATDYTRGAGRWQCLCHGNFRIATTGRRLRNASPGGRTRTTG